MTNQYQGSVSQSGQVKCQNSLDEVLVMCCIIVRFRNCLETTIMGNRCKSSTTEKKSASQQLLHLNCINIRERERSYENERLELWLCKTNFGGDSYFQSFFCFRKFATGKLRPQRERELLISFTTKLLPGFSARKHSCQPKKA